MLDENVEESLEEEVEEVEDSGEDDSESWRSKYSVKEEKDVVNETEIVDEDEDKSGTNTKSPSKETQRKAIELRKLEPEERANELQRLGNREKLALLAAMPTPEDALATLDCMSKTDRANTLASVTTKALKAIGYLPDPDFRDLMEAKLQAAMSQVKQLKWDQAEKLLKARAEVLSYYKESVKSQMEELKGKKQYGPADKRMQTLKLCQTIRSFVAKPKAADAGDAKGSKKEKKTAEPKLSAAEKARAAETAKLKSFGASLKQNGPKSEADELAAHLSSMKALVADKKNADPENEEDDAYEDDDDFEDDDGKEEEAGSGSKPASPAKSMQKTVELAPPKTPKPLEPFSQVATRHATRIRAIIKACCQEKKDADRRIEILADKEQYRDAEKAQEALERYLGDNRHTMNSLFCKAAEAGGTVLAFRDLHQEMVAASPKWTEKVPDPEATEKGTLKVVFKDGGESGQFWFPAVKMGGWGIARKKVPEKVNRKKQLTKSKMEEMAKRLCTIKKKKEEEIEQKETAKQFQQRYKDRMKAIRRGKTEQAKGGAEKTDHLLLAAQFGMVRTINGLEKCKCAWGRCSHQPKFVPADNVICRQAEDGLYPMRQRANLSASARGDFGSSTRNLGQGAS